MAIKALSPSQRRNARIIIQTGRRMGASRKVIKWALRAAIVESNLVNVNYGMDDSLGLFQQRPSQGWGTPNQVMNPRYASRQFFKRAISLDKQGFSGNLAQEVQRSAYPAKYVATPVVNLADTILSGVKGLPGAGGGFTTPSGLRLKPGTPDKLLGAPIRELANPTAPAQAKAGPAFPKNRPTGGLDISYETPARFVPGKEAQLVSAPGIKVPGISGGVKGLDFDSTKGGWQGSAPVARSLAAGLGESRTFKRTPAENSAVGGASDSDHLTTNRNAFAIDISAVGKAGDRIVNRLAKRLGVKPNRLTGTYAPIYRGKYRIQILWRVEGHYDHVHVGVRRR